MRRYLLFVLLLALLVFAVDAFVSAMATCHDVANYPSAGQNSQKHCNIYSGLLIPSLAYIRFVDPNWIIAAFTVVLALSTIGLWWATYELRSAGQEQVDIARIAADAAVKSADIARDTLHITQRAYIIALPEGVIDFAVGKRPKGGISLRNTGNTPAYDVLGRTGICLGSMPLPADFQYDITLSDGAGDSSFQILRREQQYTQWAELREPINEEHLAMFQNGQLHVYVWGSVTYKDAFGFPHYTHFCSFYDASRIGRKVPILYPHYNDCD
jgi:hypothetical protein